MKRRQFAALAGGAALWTTGTVRAQHNLPLVGFLNAASPETYRFNANSFREGLAKAGFVEGKTVRIEERWARGNYQAMRLWQPSWWRWASPQSQPQAMSLPLVPRRRRRRKYRSCSRSALIPSALAWSR